MNTQPNQTQALQSELTELKKLNTELRNAIKRLHQEVIQTKQMAQRAMEKSNRNHKDINNIIQKRQ